MKYKILLFPLLTLLAAAYAQTPTAQQIIEKVNALMNQKTVHSVATMTIHTTSGQLRTFKMESWAKNGGEKTLVRYLAPRRVKGQTTLMLNNADDIWIYFPRTNRVRKLATHAKRQKMQGSDFSYEDMGSGDAFVKEFSATLLGQEKMEGYDCYKLQLVRNPNSTSAYVKLILWVIKDKYYPVVIDYYKEDDPERPAKRLYMKDIREIQGVPTAMKMVMKNLADNTETSMENLKVEYNIPIDDAMFTTRGMKR